MKQNQEIINSETAALIDDILVYLPYGVFSKNLVRMLINDKDLLEKYNENRLSTVMAALTITGFAIQRFDIKPENELHIELSDKGKKLKELGSIAEFIKFHKNEQDNIRHQKLRDKYLFWIVLFGAIGTCISAVYDGAQMIEFYQKHSLNFQLACYFASGFGLGLLMWFLSSLLWKMKGKI